MPEYSIAHLTATTPSLLTGDSMTMDNRRQFSTADQDNDRLRYGNCARVHKAGWWFGACRRVSWQYSDEQ